MTRQAAEAVSSLLPRLARWRASRAQASGKLHPSMFAPPQGAAASTGLLPLLLLRGTAAPTATAAATAASRTVAAFHTARPSSAAASYRSSNSLWSRLVRSSGASSDPLGGALSVTNALIAANVAVAAAAASGLAPSLPSALARANWRVEGGEWYRLLAAGFVHSGWIHLAVNAYALHALRSFEGLFGGRRYLAVYLLSVVVGNYVGLREMPSFSVSCGASSGVCGVVGAYVAARLANRRLSPLTSADFSWVAQIVGINLVVQALGGGAGLDHWSHLGGAVGGAAAALLLGPRLRWARGGGGTGGGLVDAPPLPVLLWRGGRVPPGW